jgi:DNA-binding PadR family transcriptional regulator
MNDSWLTASSLQVQYQKASTVAPIALSPENIGVGRCCSYTVRSPSCMCDCTSFVAAVGVPRAMFCGRSLREKGRLARKPFGPPLTALRSETIIHLIDLWIDVYILRACSLLALGKESKDTMYELIILSLLMRFPLNRYQLAKIVNEKLGPYAKLSNGTLYPLLAKLEEAGFVAAPEQDESGERRNRGSRLFQITNAGRLRFEQLMLDTTSFLADYRQAFQFKVVSLDLLPVARRLYLLNHYITYCQAHVLHHTSGAETLAQELAMLPSTPPLYQERTLTVIRHRVEEWEAEAAWAMRLREEEGQRAEAETSEEISERN